MLSIYNLTPKSRLKQVLRQYSEAFNVPVFLLGKNRRLFLSFPESVPEHELLIKPLFVRDFLVGHVGVPSVEPKGLDFIAGNLSIILEEEYEIDSLSGEVARNYEEFSLLCNFSSKLASILDVRKVCEITAAEVMTICPSKAVAIMLIDNISSDVTSTFRHPSLLEPDVHEKDRILFTKASVGEYAAEAMNMTLNTEKGLVGHAFQRKEALTVCDVHEDKRFEGLPYPAVRILLVPLIVEEKAIGVIAATDKLNGKEFFSTDIKTISSISSECAVSVKKASLFSEIQNMLFSTAEAFSFAIEAKDPYTYGHSKRVSELSVKIARQMGLAEDVSTWIRLAALLHDIGKIGVPEDILCKVGELSSDEMSKVREHPMIGARVIECINNFGDMAKWIYHHHEKYNGSGYPGGIADGMIPLPSRIISIADVFDALTSNRPYRKAYGADEAAKIMKKAVGDHFDPTLFEYFEEAISDQCRE